MWGSGPGTLGPLSRAAGQLLCRVFAAAAAAAVACKVNGGGRRLKKSGLWSVEFQRLANQ